jgi:hypothetical protein
MVTKEERDEIFLDLMKRLVSLLERHEKELDKEIPNIPVFTDD